MEYNPEYEDDNNESEAPVEEEAVNGEEQNNGDMGDRGTEEQRTLFVGGIDFKTKEKAFHDYFEKYGEIEKAVLKTHPSGDNRGFGFIHFVHKSSVDAVLEEENHVLDNKKIGPSRKQKSKFKRESVLKVYIGGRQTPLDDSLTENDLRKYFENFGTITEIILPVDKSTNKRRDFGFVKFDDDQSVLAAVASNNRNGQQHISGKYYDIKKSEPREMLDNPYGDRGYGPPPRGPPPRGPPSRYDDYDRGYGRYDDYRSRYEPRGYDRMDRYGPRDDYYRRGPPSAPRDRDYGRIPLGRSRMTPY